MPSIINSDDGVVSGTSGLKTTGGNDGITTFQQNGTERMRITSAGDVGIGTSSPLEKLQVAGPVVSTANLSALRASTMTMDYISGGRLIATGADSSTYSPIIFGTATTTTFAERGRFEANGNLKLALNLSVGSATPTTSGTGITFPATQSASTDANTLDDYEEGSFTPVIAGSSSAGTASYSQQIGRYTKIGNRVFFQITIVWSSGTGTGNLRITSLPFTNASGAGFNPPPTLVTQNVTYTAGHFATGDVPQGQSRVDVYSCPTGGGAIADVTYDAAGDLYVSGQYFV